MSGIAGIISTYESDINIPVLKKMSNVLSHRGADGGGIWINPKNTIGLAHRRLATIDLSFNAAQPMHYKDRYSIVHDGEIYNYIEVKQELQKAGYVFKNNSDTEVILAAYDFYKESCVNYFDGKFAFAIWDEFEQCLFAARDRFGEKPFYYYKDKTRLVFGSEMKAVWSSGVEKSVDFKMLINYIALGDVQNPSDPSQTFYNKIYSLPPAHYFVLHKNEMQIEQYWSIDKNKRIEIDGASALEKLEFLLTNAIKKRMRGDGGIAINYSRDEYEIQSMLFLINSISKKQVKLYGNANATDYNQVSVEFDRVAKQYKIEHQFYLNDESDLVKDFKDLLYYQEQPFACSDYLQYQLFKQISKDDRKIVIDHTGIKQIFASDSKYANFYLQELFRRNRFTKFVSEKNKLTSNGVPVKWKLKDMVSAYLPSHVAMAEEKKLYNKIIHHPYLSKQLLSVVSGRDWDGVHRPVITQLNDILYFDAIEMGLEEKLRSSDRMSMINGIELRHPFLNSELATFMFSLPSSLKIREGYTQFISRKMMSHYLASDIVWKNEKKEVDSFPNNTMKLSQMEDFVFEAKQKLVKEKILNQHVLENKQHKNHPKTNPEYDWRYLSTANLLFNI